MVSVNSVWNPWRELEAIRRDLADARFTGRRCGFEGGDAPLFNVYTGEAGVILTTKLPGIDPESLEVSVEKDVLTVRAKREETIAEDTRVLLRERCDLRLDQQFRLPFVPVPEKTEAVYEHGVLTVRLTRPEVEKPQRIVVQVKS